VAGVYTLSLTATDTGGYISAPVTVSVTVNGAPTARLSVAQLPSPPFTVSANASASTDPDPMPIASYRFDFGDGTPAVTTTAPTAIAQHAYTAPGAYTVRVTATDTGGLTSAPATAAITVDAPPVARLTATQLASPALTVNANASASTDTDGTPIASYRFDFGDGTPAVTTTAPTASAQHTYAVAGVYTISLTATDTGGYTSAPATASVTVNGAPTARLSVTLAASPALTVNADASASTDPDPMPIASYRFDFGDGTPAIITTAPTATAQHTYAAVGTYTVRVTETDAGGLTSAATAGVTVDIPPTARLSVAQAASPPLTVSADASASTDTDGTPIASYRFDFGDGTSAVTTTAPAATAQHTYATAGSYTVTLIATDTGGFASAPATAVATITSQGSLDKRIAAGSDDAEEPTGAKPVTNSNDLELVSDASIQTVGMRWTGVSIPPRATITRAYIQFAAKETQSEATSLTIRGQAADNPSSFNTATGNISTRPRTTAAASWAPLAWNTGEAGANQRTPDLSGVVQEIVSRTGWASGNALAIIVTGTGHRTAWSYNGSSSQAPLLHVEYTGAPPADAPPVARLTVAQAPSPALTVTANGSTSTDTDGTPIASYRFTFGDGTAAVTTTAPTAIAQHTYAAAGTYTVTLTATDTGGLTSAPATASITVNPPDLPPVARLTVAQAASPPLTVNASGSTSTDTDATPIASYRFTFGDGTPAVTTTAPTATAQHTYAAAGTYTVTLTATDTGGLVSTPVTASITVNPPAADSPPIARLALTPAASPPLTVIGDASASTDTDATPIASYRFDFGDGTPAVTTTAPAATAQHTYAAPGTYTVTLIVTDTAGLPSTPATASVTFSAPTTLERRVAAWIDDVEEVASGTVYVNSSDLELVTDGSAAQTVGIRWTGLTIPSGAVITAAYVQFASKEAQSEITSLTFRADASDNAPSFGSSPFNASARARTTASVLWAPVAWVAGETAVNQRTPDLRLVIQEIVSRTGWASGNAIAILVNGTGHRTAWAYDGSAAAAPLLHVEYTAGASASMAGPASLEDSADEPAAADAPGGPIPPIALIAPAAPPPAHLALSSARPNPVSGPVSFRIELPERTSIRWGIYDLQGRQLWSESRTFEAGRTDLSWDGRATAGSRAGSGLYFARVHADNRVLIRRFIRL
jgi:PKD repeat protein